MGSPTKSFQHVYRRIATGGYYTNAEFPVQGDKPDHKQVSGKPAYLLAPVFRLFQLNDSEQGHSEILSFPRDQRAGRLSVGAQEMLLHFEQLDHYRAVQNSDLDNLLAEYADEGMKNTPEHLARIAHRYAQTMEDCQARCLLELMARVLDQLPPGDKSPCPLDERGPGVVK